MTGKLKQITDILDMAWEDLLYDPATLLPTLFDIDQIDDRWLEHLKPLLGFTRDLSFDVTIEELRRVLSIAVPYWNDKPSEEGVISDAIRMATGNRFRVSNWFDFRSQIDTTCVTEELEDFDPHMLGFETFKFTGSVLSVHSATQFQLADLPSGLPLGFESAHQFAWLIIRNDTSSPSNNGVYKIDRLLPWTSIGLIEGVFPRIGGDDVEWELIGWADEYVNEVRLVERGIGTLAYEALSTPFTVGQLLVGGESAATAEIVADAASVLSLRAIYGRFVDGEQITDATGGAATTAGKVEGVVNRELIAFLMDGEGKTQRPFSERINLVYINFLDQFLTAADLDQWTLTGDVVSTGGMAVMPAASQMIDADSDSPNWGDQVTAWKIITDDTTGVFHLVFFYQDDDNHYFVEVDYAAKTVKLFKKVATVDTQLGSTATLGYLKVGIQDVVRVDALAEGANTRVRVKVNGELEVDVADTPSAFTAGRVGVRADTGVCKVKLVEVNVLPSEIQRIGPEQ